jgi:NADH-ubiquinone oxidoreductase chain 1
MCIFTSILFLGGYLLPFHNIINLLTWVYDMYNTWLLPNGMYSFGYEIMLLNEYIKTMENSIILDGLMYSIILGIKTCIMIFIFIWVRASFPRIRFDQLMSFCWTVLLPLLFGFIILVPCILYSYGAFLINISIF